MPEYWHYAYYVYYLQQFCRVVDFFVVSLNTNFRLNSGGESSVKGWKILQVFFKEQGHCDPGDELHR